MLLLYRWRLGGEHKQGVHGGLEACVDLTKLDFSNCYKVI